MFCGDRIISSEVARRDGWPPPGRAAKRCMLRCEEHQLGWATRAQGRLCYLKCTPHANRTKPPITLKPEPSILTGSGRLFEHVPERREAKLNSASDRGRSRLGVYKAYLPCGSTAKDLVTEPGLSARAKRWERIWPCLYRFCFPSSLAPFLTLSVP